MKSAILACALLLSVVLSGQASAAVDRSGVMNTRAVHHTVKKPSLKSRARRPGSGVITYDHDSKNPNIGWHWRGGMRACTQDCDNPEIPGSGFTCRNVRLFGIDWRECTRTD